MDEPEDKSKEFNDNDELPELEVLSIVDKSKLLEKQTLTIKGLRFNRFGKPQLEVLGSTDDYTGLLNINNTLWNSLRSEFGTKKSDIINKQIIASATKTDPNNERISGYELKFEYQ